jgi:hypothetical protein
MIAKVKENELANFRLRRVRGTLRITYQWLRTRFREQKNTCNSRSFSAKLAAASGLAR